MTDTPVVASPAQQRVVTDVLGWGETRPVAPDRLVEGLRTRLEDGLAALGAPLERLAASRRGGRLMVSPGLLQRGVCQGWLLAPEPFEHTPATVRGVVGRAAILADLADGRRGDPADVVAAHWRRMASDRPGDPRSLAAWMNAADGDVRAELQAEIADLVAGVREVWPVLPPDRVEVAVDTRVRIPLLDGTVELVSTLDLTVTSRVADARARGLVVDLRTGRPRAPTDRLALRFAALCSMLAEGVPPFRWTTFYVTEGRFVSEDLATGGGWNDDALGAVVDRVVGVVEALVELEDVDADVAPSQLRLAAGWWCTSCRRRGDCPVAAAAR